MLIFRLTFPFYCCFLWCFNPNFTALKKLIFIMTMVLRRQKNLLLVIAANNTFEGKRLKQSSRHGTERGTIVSNQLSNLQSLFN